ncbi:uncharacterized protein Tco025E_04419 [Trypanosoma conorhini]|uniref:Uncharacterized protein n=1 Tax=Trypanosoma conorhini TaxID=83891 RepID=A0A422PLN9_9TRYP|nr:uncharacterized protein Tco025E_04419 [Trypanosoma conorhini]RNF18621.1 hypothetical protein Tco025E_04419 [Trypanosoma conorhini]
MCREASPAPLLQFPAPAPAARQQEPRPTEWWAFSGHGRRSAPRPNELPVPQRATATQDGVHRALSWSTHEETELPCGVATSRQSGGGTTPPGTGRANGSPAPEFACRGVADDNDDDGSPLSIGSHSHDVEEVSLGRRALLLRTSEKCGAAAAACRGAVPPKSPRQDENGEAESSAAPHASSLPRSTVSAPAPPDRVDGLAQLMAGLRQAILQLSGEMRELRLAIQELRGPPMNGRGKRLSQPEISEAMAVAPEPRRGEPALTSSSSSLTPLRTPEATSCRPASPVLHTGCPMALLDAGIVSAVSEGLMELRGLPSFLPARTPRRS